MEQTYSTAQFTFKILKCRNQALSILCLGFMPFLVSIQSPQSCSLDQIQSNKNENTSLYNYHELFKSKTVGQRN